jgi:hypothetical protein
MPTLRIAAVQLFFHPAFEGGGVQSLREPTGLWEGRGLSGLQIGAEAPDALLERLGERFCRELAVDVLVLSEYAVPLTLLRALDEAAGPTMTVVAGTHMVTSAGVRKSDVTRGSVRPTEATV